MSDREINIFRAIDSAEGWFERDVSSVMSRLITHAKDLLGDAPGNRVILVDNPQPQSKARRVGRVFVEPVEDDSEYIVSPQDDLQGSMDDGAAAVIGTETDLKRQPSGDVGTWSIQAVIFDNENFTLDQAREWIANNDSYDDYGFEETDKAYHFRQYDRRWFDLFRIIAVDEGVSAVYAQIAAEPKEEIAAQVYAAAEKAYTAVRQMNLMIAAKGLTLISAAKDTVKKQEGAGEIEEHFILGIVLEPTKRAGGKLEPDTQDDVYTAETIRDAAHGWMEFHGHIDLMHNWQALSKNDVRILETYTAPVSFTIGSGDDAYKVLKGTWLVALRIVNEELWAAVKSGDLGAFSIGGIATRTPLEA